MFFAIYKENNVVYCTADTLQMLYSFINADPNVSINDFILAEEMEMDFVSRITYVDDVCVYRNINFWNQDFTDFIKNYSDHKVIDFVGDSVSLNRFEAELSDNLKYIRKIDGKSGRIKYDMAVGQDFISLFREECIDTDFDYSTGVSPITIWAKMQHVMIPKSIVSHNVEDTTYIDADLISMIYAGCFREVAQALSFVEPDIFLTAERIQKYVDMLNSADAILYSTDKDYYYKESDTSADETEEEPIEISETSNSDDEETDTGDTETTDTETSSETTDDSSNVVDGSDSYSASDDDIIEPGDSAD